MHLVGARAKASGGGSGDRNAAEQFAAGISTWKYAGPGGVVGAQDVGGGGGQVELQAVAVDGERLRQEACTL